MLVLPAEHRPAVAWWSLPALCSGGEQVTATVTSVCAGCGATFEQPADPGRRRLYHDNACRQRAYRARGGRASGTRTSKAQQEQRQAEEEAWAEAEAKKERERQRSQRRRGRGAERIDVPDWCRPVATDNPDRAKRRRTCAALMARAGHEGTPEPEARECRKKANTLRVIYGL